MKKEIVSVFYIGFLLPLCAQNVIPITGDEFIQPGFSLNFTIGEPVSETFPVGNYFLTQGFQQPGYEGMTYNLDSDSLALVALYNATNGPGWTDNTNWLTGPLASWHGITLDDDRVSHIELKFNNLLGVLPPEIGNLSQLTYLNLRGNQLSASIPDEIGNLSNLGTLDLGQNDLSGTIPPQIGNLMMLHILILLDNELSGSIPTELWGLENLIMLSLSFNFLVGELPDEIGNLTNLIHLNLYSNQFSGTLPDALFLLVNLESLAIGWNDFIGPLSMELCTNLINLSELSLNWCNFGQESCDVVNCLLNRGGWEYFEHSPQKNDFTYPGDCPCENAISDAWGVNIICEDQNVLLYGYAVNFTSTLWETSGDGYFADPLAFDTQYFPGTNDLLEGNVTFYFTAFAVDPCLDETSGTAVEIIKNPSAYAGPDATTGFGQLFTLNFALAENYGELFWETTNGSGAFDDIGILHPTYTPSVTDSLLGCISIVLNAFAAEPCVISASDEMLLCFNSQKIEVPSGWSGISSYLLPTEADVEDVLAPFVQDLVIMSNFEGLYFPGENINTLGNWDIGSGYQIKALAPFQINISGENYDGTDLWKGPGWSFLPVLSSCEVDVEELFQLNFNLIIVKEVASPGVYWPEYNINTIGSLQPGKSYFVYLSDDEQIGFPDCGTEWTCGDPLIDARDAQTYATVQIGNQCWMAENLKATQYRNGVPIDYPGNSNTLWQNNTNGAYAWYNNDITWKESYGALYNWFAVTNDNGLCPAGWHVPNLNEWTQMIGNLSGGIEFGGNQLKSCSQVNSPVGGQCTTSDHPRWDADEIEFGTDDYGFSAFPGGYRYPYNYDKLGQRGHWWSSSDYNDNYAYHYDIHTQFPSISRNAAYQKNFGLSIRCIKDDPSQVCMPTVITSEITEITANSASGGGNVIHDGGADIIARGVVFSTIANPTVENNDGMTSNGAGTGIYFSELINLSPLTNYYVRAYTTNIIGTAYGNEIGFTTLSDGQPCPGAPTVTDIDGNVYNTVLIGNQCWMKENLKTNRYRNGTNIEYPGSDTIAWVNNTNGAYAWYDNDLTWKDSYGALYNWFAVTNSNGLCPAGWHVPTDSEWTELTDFIGGTASPNGNKLKSCRQVYSPLGGDCSTMEHPRWDADEIEFGTDVYGFSGLPGGVKFSTGNSVGLGRYGMWYSSDEQYQISAWSYALANNWSKLFRNSLYKNSAFSVRCLRD